jgi:hypothetical protein
MIKFDMDRIVIGLDRASGIHEKVLEFVCDVGRAEEEI